MVSLVTLTQIALYVLSHVDYGRVAADEAASDTASARGSVPRLESKSIVVVTSNYHTRRALYIFKREFPGGIVVSVASAPDGDFDPSRWWEKRLSAKLFVHELTGMVDAAWELRDSNGESEQSGAASRKS